jgi:hypothetical protein
MADLVADHRWQDTALGAVASWDPALRWAVDLILACPVPMALVCGESGLLVYNDAFVTLMGDKHPAALGRPTARVFAEMWDIDGVGDSITRVYRTGESYTDAERWLPIVRTGTSGRAE